MSTISFSEIQRDPVAFLRRLGAGESLVVLDGMRAVAEVKPLSPRTAGKRPWGLAAGEFTVPDDFDAPLPDDVLKDFEGR